MGHHLKGRRVIAIVLCLVLLICNNSNIFADNENVHQEKGKGFTIVWKNSYNMKVNYVDEKGQTINSNIGREKISIDEDTIDFTQFKNDVEDWELLYATPYQYDNSNHCTSAKLELTDHIFWTDVKVHLINDGTPVYTADNNIPEIYLVYRAVAKPPKSEDIYNTVSSNSNISVDLFDYKVSGSNKSSESIKSPASYSEGEGINRNHYLKFLSNSSEGSPDWNKYYEGYGARQGMVNSQLGADSYPVLSSWGDNESLSYLFDKKDISNAKKSYPGVDRLFIKDSEGYYYYNSEEQYATVAADPAKKNFTVYKGKKQGFFPFTDYMKASNLSPNSKGDILGSDEINHFFGMTVNTDFIQPYEGKIKEKPMIFEFSGDDDVWVFIDGVLVLDLGGIHARVAGKIDFATGKVTIDNVARSSYETTIKDLFKKAKADVGDEEFEGNTFASYSTHTMKFFYLERGNYDSNCKLKFNLQTLPKGKLYVSKVASGVDATDESEYQFVLKDKMGEPVAGAAYSKDDGRKYTTDNRGCFSLHKNEYIIFDGLSAGDYTVTETGIKNSQYSLEEFTSKISVNGSASVVSNDRIARVQISDASSARVEFKNLRDEVAKNNCEFRKVIKYNEESDDYDLTLSFKGPEEKVTTTDIDETTTTSTSKADLVFVVDMSGSMKDDNKLNNSKKSIKSMMDILKNGKVDVRYKMVTFNQSATIMNENDGWVDARTFDAWVNGLSKPNEATNYQDALVKAQKAVTSNARQDAEKVVVFLTDGEPTYHLSNYWGTVQNDGTYLRGGAYQTEEDDYKGAIMGAQALTGCDMFYSIGIGLDEKKVVYSYNLDWVTKVNKTALNILEDVTAAVPDAKIKGAYNSKSTDLSKLFESLAEQIVTDVTTIVTEKYYYSSNVTITDNLSEYAQVVEDTEFTITAVDGTGSEVGVADKGRIGKNDALYTISRDNKQYVIRARYDDTDKKLNLEFPEDYELKDGIQYAVTFRIKATAYAYEQFRSQGYNQVGDEDTDAVNNHTSSGKPGFRSNTKASVTYTYKGKKKTETYKHPVIQIRQISDWELYKTSQTSDGIKLEGAEFVLSNDNNLYTGVSDSNGKVIWDKTFIEPGEYILKESKAPIGYELNKLELTVRIDDNGSISVLNGDTIVNPDSQVTSSKDGVTSTLSIFNYADKALYTLPEAGGNGIFAYMISGILMMMGGALLIYKRRKSLV